MNEIMKSKIITAYQDNHKDLIISKKTKQFEDVLWNTGYETAMQFVLTLMGINCEKALTMKVNEKIEMKNVKRNQLKKCIFIGLEEFTKLIENLTDGLQTVEYEDGIYFTSTKKSEELDEYWNENILTTLSNYFNVEVTSVHSDNCEYVGVWICYME